MSDFLRKGRSFIVAEVSANHGQDLRRALSLVRQAKRCGADAVKFQTYTPDTLTLDIKNRFFRVRHHKWGGQTLYQLYKKTYAPWEWFPKLKKAARESGLAFFSTVYDRSSVDFMEELGVPFYKISSFEITDLELIAYAARTKKPLFMSTGIADRDEIRDAVRAAKEAGARDIILLKCVSSYPARAEEMNLKTMPDMARSFNVQVGVSDHTLGSIVPVTAVNLGAVLIEKHFTLDRRLNTPDNFFSTQPGEFRQMVADVREAEKAMGGVTYRLSGEQKKNRVFARSLFAVRDIEKGEAFTRKNVASIRPGYGLPPKLIGRLLGARSRIKISRGSPLTSKVFKG